MTIISGLGPTPAIRGGPVRTTSGGFAVPASDAASVASLAAPTAPSGLLALQEAGQEAGRDAVRDREARRHGAALLAALTELQRALLTGPGGSPIDLDRLAALVRNAPPPADPALAAVQRAVLIRAAVELARRTPQPAHQP